MLNVKSSRIPFQKFSDFVIASKTWKSRAFTNLTTTPICLVNFKFFIQKLGEYEERLYDLYDFRP